MPSHGRLLENEKGCGCVKGFFSFVADPANSFFDDEKSGTSPDLLVSRERGPTQLSFSPAFLGFVVAPI